MEGGLVSGFAVFINTTSSKHKSRLTYYDNSKYDNSSDPCNSEGFHTRVL